MIKDLFGKEAVFCVSIEGRFGDYASNAAMAVAKEIGLNPRETAEKIKEGLKKSEALGEKISKIEIAGPGFLNFTLSERGLIEGLKLLDKKPKVKKKKIQVEFISANPTGELHVGHARSAFYGDALANTLEAYGYDVEREYFINDSKESTQIKELGKTVLGEGENYLTDYLKSKINKLKVENREFKDAGEAGYLISKEIQKGNEKFIVEYLGVKFDKWFSEEEEMRKKNEFKKTLELLKKKQFVYEKEGALWLKTSEFGDDEDRVVLRSDGSVSYFLSDITYHSNKFSRKYDLVIDIWGADHQGHVKRMMAVKKMLVWGGDLEILISQMVTLKEGGETKKLSKRKGTIVLLKDLVDEIGIDAARWFYLQKSLSTHMEFDMALAKERSQKNPVFYVQYAGARMHSILEKSGIRNRESGTISKICQVSAARSLILKLIRFFEVVEDTAGDYQIQRITTYAYELASEFSQFYRDVKVIGSENENELIVLVALTRKVLKDALKLLGISAPDRM